MPIEDVKRFLQDSGVTLTEDMKESAMRMKMKQLQHRGLLTPEKRKMVHKEQLNPMKAKSLDEFCDVVVKYENGDFVFDNRRVMTVKFSMYSIDNMSLTALRCSETCHCILKDGHCMICKKGGLRGVVKFSIPMLLQDLESEKQFQVNGWKDVGAVMFPGKTPAAVRKMSAKDVDVFADEWLHPYPLIAKMMITVRDAAPAFPPQAPVAPSQRKINITMFELSKIDL